MFIFYDKEICEFRYLKFSSFLLKFSGFCHGLTPHAKVLEIQNQFSFRNSHDIAFGAGISFNSKIFILLKKQLFHKNFGFSLNNYQKILIFTVSWKGNL